MEELQMSRLVGPVSLFTTNDEQMLSFSPQRPGFKVEGGEKERLFLLVYVVSFFDAFCKCFLLLLCHQVNYSLALNRKQPKPL